MDCPVHHLGWKHTTQETTALRQWPSLMIRQSLQLLTDATGEGIVREDTLEIPPTTKSCILRDPSVGNSWDKKNPRGLPVFAPLTQSFDL